MKHSIPITRKNIHMIAAQVDIPAKKLQEMVVKSKIEFEREQDIKWAIQKLGKTQEWYDEAIKKIANIRDTLPKDISGKEEVVKLYGWIADTLPNMDFSIPLQNDKEYVRASSVEMIMTNPSLYLKVINWD